MKLKKAVAVLLALGIACAVPGYRQVRETAARQSVPLTIVVDPGHGGIDGGAQGADGTTEAELNLALAESIREEAERYGVRTVLTRESSEGVRPAGSDGKWSKTADMRERIRIIEAAAPDLTISVHLNSFPADPSVHGAQVFFPGDGNASFQAESSTVAKAVQQSLERHLAGNGKRAVMPKNGIYLMKHCSAPMILVECGFLSNSADLQNLKHDQFRNVTAQAIMEAVAACYEIEAPKKSEYIVIDSRTAQ